MSCGFPHFEHRKIALGLHIGPCGFLSFTLCPDRRVSAAKAGTGGRTAGTAHCASEPCGSCHEAGWKAERPTVATGYSHNQLPAAAIRARTLPHELWVVPKPQWFVDVAHARNDRISEVNGRDAAPEPDCRLRIVSRTVAVVKSPLHR
jgi:hypothetical protein